MRFPAPVIVVLSSPKVVSDALYLVRYVSLTASADAAWWSSKVVITVQVSETSGWVGLPQVGQIAMSEYVALRLPLPGVVVTWIVTGFPLSGRPSVCARYRLSLLPTRQAYVDGTRRRRLAKYMCVPRTSSMSCDQTIFVDHATDASLS